MSDTEPSDRLAHEQHPPNQPHTQPDDDDRDAVEYLRVVVEKQLLPCTDLDRDAPAGHKTGQSDLYLAEYAPDADMTRRLRLRLQHPDSTVSDVSPMLSPAEMDVFLRGMIRGERGRIDRLAEHVDDGEGDA
jgi:hypothetical protein